MTNLSGKFETNAHVRCPPSMNADAKSFLKCTTSKHLFKATIKSMTSAAYSTLSKIFFKIGGPCTLSATYCSDDLPPFANAAYAA